MIIRKKKQYFHDFCVHWMLRTEKLLFYSTLCAMITAITYSIHDLNSCCWLYFHSFPSKHITLQLLKLSFAALVWKSEFLPFQNVRHSSEVYVENGFNNEHWKKKNKKRTGKKKNVEMHTNTNVCRSRLNIFHNDVLTVFFFFFCALCWSVFVLFHCGCCYFFCVPCPEYTRKPNTMIKTSIILVIVIAPTIFMKVPIFSVIDKRKTEASTMNVKYLFNSISRAMFSLYKMF